MPDIDRQRVDSGARTSFQTPGVRAVTRARRPQRRYAGAGSRPDGVAAGVEAAAVYDDTIRIGVGCYSGVHDRGRRLVDEYDGFAAEGPQRHLAHYSGVMRETDADRFLSLAEECLKQAEKATSPLDKDAWLKLAEEWLQLARAARKRGR